MWSKKPKVYLASPYTKGDVAINVYNVMKVADKLLEFGFIPFVPHLTHFWNIMSPKHYSVWLEIDNEFLKCCDIVLRLEGESEGADKEVELAKYINIPVVHSITELLHFYGRKIKYVE